MGLKSLMRSNSARDKRARVALVTGGSRGIGRALVELLTRRGYRVSFCYLNEDNMREIRHDFDEEMVLPVLADVSKAGDCQRFVEASLERWRDIDLLVNNAGVIWSGAFKDEPIEEVDRLVDTNLKGVMYMTKAVLPRMLEGDGGTIVNVASGAGKTGYENLATYSATKFGVVGLTQALAGELIDKGIRVYAVCPGAVATDMQVEVSGVRAGIEPEVVAEHIVQIASDNPPIKPGTCLDIY